MLHDKLNMKLMTIQNLDKCNLWFWVSLKMYAASMSDVLYQSLVSIIERKHVFDF